jgi:hypothetical protein
VPNFRRIADLFDERPRRPRTLSDVPDPTRPGRVPGAQGTSGRDDFQRADSLAGLIARTLRSGRRRR